MIAIGFFSVDSRCAFTEVNSVNEKNIGCDYWIRIYLIVI
jgi:hypothetical protein